MSTRSLLYLLTLALASGLHLWLAATAKPSASEPERIYTLDGGGSPTWGVAFSPQSHLLATGSEDQTAKLWDLATGHLRHTLIGNAGTVGDVAFSPDGRMSATGNAQGFVTIWDVASGRRHDWLQGVWGPLAFSPGGRLLATAQDNQVKLWDTHSWNAVRALRGARLPWSPL
jgi:WD40 repeat protein